jgi:ribonuclease HI
MDDENIIQIWTDGACRGQNQEKSLDRQTIGAWAYLIKYKNDQTSSFEASIQTTSNQQELLGVINALKILKKFSVPIVIYSDSKLVVNGMTLWIKNWMKNGWQTKSHELVKNKDLWIELNNLTSKFDQVEFRHIKGHAGNKENEQVDLLANIAMDIYLEKENIK